MFGKRNKPSQSQQDDFAPADFSEDFGDTFESPDADLQGDAAAWGDPQETAAPQAQATPSQKKSASGSGKMLPVLAVAGLGIAAAGYFFLLPQGNSSQPVVAEVGQTQENAPLLALPATDAPASQQLAASPIMTPTEGVPASQTEAAPVVSGEASDALPASPLASADNQLPSAASAPSDMAASPSVDETPLASASEPTTPLEPVSAAEPLAQSTAPSTASDVTAAVSPVLAAAPVSAPVAPLSQSLPSQTALPQASQPVSVPLVQAPSPVQAKPAVDVSGDVSALSARLTVLERQIDDLTKAVDKMAAATPPSEAVARLSKTVDALSKQVGSLKTAAVATPVIATSRPLVAPAAAEAVSEPTAASTPVLSATSSAPVVSQPAMRADAPAKVPAKSVAWVLRAAQSGTAWVSPSKDGDLQRVAVGETLAGVGRIQSIEIKDGAWEITGTKGKIRQ